MDKNQQILDFIRARGPSQPVAVGKEVREDSIVAGAYLATLLERKELKVSHLKVGGSPLYYVPGQEAKLQNFSDRLNPVDRKTYELLKEKKILREKALEPIERVSLKQLRDFAIPLNVRIGEEMEVFWKWYLLPEQETEVIVKRILHITEPKPKEEPKVIPVPIERLVPVERPAEILRKSIAEERKVEEKREEELTRERPAVQERARVQERLIEPSRESQKILVKETDLNDKFYDQLREYFSRNKIEILETNIIKKGAEIDLLIEVPSAMGRLTYYCKAKSKKRSSESDLAAAFVQAQMKKLPALYLTRGELTKKAGEMLNREFRGLIFRKF